MRRGRLHTLAESTTSYQPRGNGKGPILVLALVALAGLGFGFFWWTRTDSATLPHLRRENGATPNLEAQDVAPPLDDSQPSRAPGGDEAHEGGSGEDSSVATTLDRLADNVPIERPAAAGSKTTLKPAENKALEAARAAVEKARQQSDAQILRKALSALVLQDALAASERVAALQELDAINNRLIWSATPGPGFIAEKVQPGDSYWTICKRLRKRDIRVTSGLLTAINRVPANRLRVGRPLKVPTESLSLMVDKSEFRIYVLLGGVVVRTYPIGIGKNDLTPEGTFTIGGKTAKPVWRDPKTGKVFKYGEEGHVIGSRWMAFQTEGFGSGYGIHGTVEPESIGKAASEGCIRMGSEQVEELFDLVPEGTPVEIRG